MGTWHQDLRLALRTLGKSRGFVIVATLTLGLGIGANTAIFSLLDEALFQPLPVERPDQLRAAMTVSRSGEQMSNVPSEFFQELRRAPRSFSAVLACWRTEMNFDAGTDVDRVLVQYASGGYYSGLGVRMLLGRAIGDSDENNPDRVAVLSHRFWFRRFGGNPAVLGRTVRLNGVPATIVGVTPPEFSGVDRGVSPDVTVPLTNPAPFANLWVTVRLRPGVDDREAEAEAATALQRALETIRPRLARYRAADRDWMLTLRPVLGPAERGVGVAMRPYVQPLQLLILLSAGVLFIACVNLASLLLARALGRRDEFGLRLALGATRLHLVRQVLAESLLLASLGSAVGLAAAVGIQRAVVGLLMDDLAHRTLGFGLNAHVLAFTFALGTTTVLVFGLTPALRATRIDLRSSLRPASGTGTTRGFLARGLLAGQVAVTLVLLVAAGLLLQSFANLQAIDTGVPADRMLTMRIGLSARETGRRVSTRVYRDLVDRVQSIPGVSAAALGWDSALASGGSSKSIWVQGQPLEERQSAGFNVVGPGFFAAVGVPVVLGREFGPSDDSTARQVVMVNEAWVRRYAGRRNPIGLHLGDDGAGSISKYEIVGVVHDSRTVALRTPPAPMLYQPLLQDEWASSAVLHVRTLGDPWAMAARVREAIRAYDAALPVYDLTTLDARRAQAVQRDRMMATLSTCFGGAALALTALGIYGVIAYGVARRRAEVGIRIALGATAASIHWLVVREILVLVAIGASAGVPLSIAVAPLLRSALFGVAPHDPVIVAASVATVLVGGCLGGYLPARRAARLEPAIALRAE